jgi:hypothetical protein
VTDSVAPRLADEQDRGAAECLMSLSIQCWNKLIHFIDATKASLYDHPPLMAQGHVEGSRHVAFGTPDLALPAVRFFLPGIRRHGSRRDAAGHARRHRPDPRSPGSPARGATTPLRKKRGRTYFFTLSRPESFHGRGAKYAHGKINLSPFGRFGS